MVVDRKQDNLSSSELVPLHISNFNYKTQKCQKYVIFLIEEILNFLNPHTNTWNVRLYWTECKTLVK